MSEGDVMPVLWILSVSLVYAANASGSLGEVLKPYGIRVRDDKSFKVLKNQQSSGSTRQHQVVEVETTGRERIEIRLVRPVETAAAQSTIAAESAAVKKLYEAQQTPYMGDIAQALGGCPPAMGPVLAQVAVGKQKGEAVVGAVNSDYSFGACASDQASYKGAYLAYFDEGTKTLWTWRVFAPWTGGKKAIDADWLKPILNRFE